MNSETKKSQNKNVMAQKCFLLKSNRDKYMFIISFKKSQVNVFKIVYTYNAPIYNMIKKPRVSITKYI